MGNNILQYYWFYCIFEQINAAFVGIKDFCQKHLKNLNYSKCFDWCSVSIQCRSVFFFKNLKKWILLFSKDVLNW